MLLDVNVLVALTVDAHVHHEAAHRHLAGAEHWATCSLTETALVRLLLNPLTTGRSLHPADVLVVLRNIRAQPSWDFLADPTSLADPVIDTQPLAGTKQVSDFHLVNLAATHGRSLVTFDRRIPAALAPADRRHVEVITTT